MKKKKLHMIGNAHINPVWQWQEGSQEVKSIFRDPQAGHQGQYPAPQIGQGDRGRLCILQDQDLPRPTAENLPVSETNLLEWEVPEG